MHGITLGQTGAGRVTDTPGGGVSTVSTEDITNLFRVRAHSRAGRAIDSTITPKKLEKALPESVNYAAFDVNPIKKATCEHFASGLMMEAAGIEPAS